MDLTQRLCAHLFFGKSFAEAVTRNMQDLLDATSSCQRIVDTPLPFLYSHMLSLLLFVFVYSTPFMFSFPTDDGGGDERGECSRLGWLPSILLVLGYYGFRQGRQAVEGDRQQARSDGRLGRPHWRAGARAAQRVRLPERAYLAVT